MNTTTHRPISWDELADEVSALRELLKESESTAMVQKAVSNSLAAINAWLKDERDKLQIANERLEKENSALRFEVERLQKRINISAV